MLARSGVDLRLNTEATPEALQGFDAVVIATGVTPRSPGIEGEDRAVSYIDILSGRVTAGPRVAIVGAGGIGFDVAEYLSVGESPTLHPENWMREWGVGDPAQVPGGLAEPQPEPPVRQVTLLQRKPEKPGRKLGKTTGWIHRAALAATVVRYRGKSAVRDVARAFDLPPGQIALLAQLLVGERVIDGDAGVLRGLAFQRYIQPLAHDEIGDFFQDGPDASGLVLAHNCDMLERFGHGEELHHSTMARPRMRWG